MILGYGCNGCDKPTPVEDCFVCDISKEPDSVGNLIIENNSDLELVLFIGNKPLKIIPAVIDPFLIKVEEADDDVVDMRLFKIEDVEEANEQPPLDDVHKRWIEIIASDYDEDHRTYWPVNANTKEKSVGTIIMSYTSTNSVRVDVHRDDENGLKIASLKPGIVNRKFGMDFGTHIYLYHYWESDNQSPDGRRYYEWVKKEEINNQWVIIERTLNANNKKAYLRIPIYKPPEFPTGYISVKNNTARTIFIYINDTIPIEDQVVTDQDKSNISEIPTQDQYEYQLEVGSYNLVAKYSTGEEIARTSIELTEGLKITWTIPENTLDSNLIFSDEIPAGFLH